MSLLTFRIPLRTSLLALSLLFLLPLDSAQTQQENGANEDEKAMTFTLSGNGGNCVGCEWIAASGRITKDSYKHYLAMETEIPILLHSTGGDLDGAIKLGEAFRERAAWIGIGQNEPIPDSAFSEQVAGTCTGHCVWAFIGGARRHAEPDQIELPDLSSKGVLTKSLFDHVQDMGVNPDILRRAMESEAADRLLGNSEVLEAYGLDYLPEDLQPWRLLANNGALIARSTSRDGMRQISYQCSQAGGRQLVLREEQQQNSPYAMPLIPEMITDFQTLTFAGTTFPTKVVKASNQDFTTEIILDLPKTFQASFKLEDLQLANEAPTRMMDMRLFLSPHNAEQSFAMVDRICSVK